VFPPHIVLLTEPKHRGLKSVVHLETITKKLKKESIPDQKSVKMVENTLKNMKESVISVQKLKKTLPKKIENNNLRKILRFLDEKNKITLSLKGIIWLENKSPKLRKVIAQGTLH
jgi:hypothetical protein